MLDETGFKPRKRILTDDDIKALAKEFMDCHKCRFENISSEEMDFVKDLVTVFKETRSEIIKWLVKGALYAILIIAGLTGYFKLKH